MKRAARSRLFGSLLAAIALVHPVAITADTLDLNIEARAIDRFSFLSSETRFGLLDFVGGLELTASSRNFGGLSSFRFLEPGGRFIGVSDTGLWLFGRVERDGDLKPIGWDAVTMQDMVGADGEPVEEKWLADAESLAVRDGVASVGFEREHRIEDFKIEVGEDGSGQMGAAIGKRDFLVPRAELRANRGFETLAFAPKDSPLGGALVALTEMSLDTKGDIFAAVLDGPKKGVFTVKRIGDFSITDGAFLPDGDLLILERRFTFTTGVGMRLRRIDGTTIGKGKLADGPILLEADMSYQIDNMEGLDVWRRSDGALIVSLLSDDNQSLLQRTLYLEFRLLE